ncbi:MAG TPA: M14 family metallopeptidase [Chryseosolibacter sp.]
MKIKILLPLLICVNFTTRGQNQWPESLILTPEKSNFVKTSTYSEVMQFIAAIAPMAPNAHVVSMGKSPEGKEIPVVVLASGKVTTPAEAVASGKPVIYVQGNIHAGEVEGKEAVMMLMRDILLGNKKHLLQNQIILFAPIYNTDSNDKMEKGRRPSQEDSPMEIGIRENSQGLDLNRDGVKMEAPETQGLITNIITKWDPQMFVDLHTTNGTWHAYSLTWAPSYHYAGEFGTYDFVNNRMLKDITKTVGAKYGMFLGPYGDYDVSQGWPLKSFYTYNHHPRYLVNQFGLRNRMAILSEAFSHERFYQRIFSTYAFVTEILEYTNSHAKEIVAINKKAEDDAIRNVRENAGKVKKGVRFRMVSNEKLDDFRTYDYVSTSKPDGTRESFRTGNVITVDSVNYFATFTAEVESTLPRGYIIPAEFSAIADHLRKHGVKVDQLTKAASYKGERFHIAELKKSQRKFEGHFMASLSGEFKAETKKFKRGDYIIDLAQPLANFVFYLLEPQSDDGLVNWNFFDSYIEKQKADNKTVVYPVFKYY